MDGLKSLHELGRHVADEQDASLARSDLHAARQELLMKTRGWERSKPASRLPRTLAVGATLAAAAALILTFAWTYEGDSGRLQVKVDGEPVEHEALDHWWSAPTDRTLPIEFSDGTKVALEPRSRARMLQVGEHGAHIVLESGSTSIQVVPRESANWQVSAGPFLVQVVGTSFDVEWGPDDDEFVLALHKGRVNLSGCVFGSGRSVVAGETVRASCKSRKYEIATRESEATRQRAKSSDEHSSAEPGAGSANPLPRDHGASTEQSVATPQGIAGRAPSWRQLASTGKYKEAVDAATKTGFEDVLASASADDLALLGDAARYAGRPEQAIDAYEKLRARYPGTNRASTAAYSLARTHFDQRGAYALAAKWFQLYLREQPGGPLAREARGRLMESLSRTGDSAGARRVAEAYLKRYPTGPHSALAKSLVSPDGRDAER